MNRQAYIVGGARIPFMKSMTKYSSVTTHDLMLASLNALIEKYSLQGKELGDVALGAVMNSSSNWNLAREVVQSTALAATTPAYNVQRACGTSLETAWQLAHKISAGDMNSGIAAGVDTNSDLPIMLSRSMAQKLIRLNATRSIGEKLFPAFVRKILSRNCQRWLNLVRKNQWAIIPSSWLRNGKFLSANKMNWPWQVI